MTRLYSKLFCECFRARGYKTFFMLNSAEHEFFPAYKCENANKNVNGILTFMSRKNAILGLSEPENS